MSAWNENHSSLQGRLPIQIQLPTRTFRQVPNGQVAIGEARHPRLVEYLTNDFACAKPPSTRGRRGRRIESTAYVRRKKRVFKRVDASRASTSRTGSDAEKSYARPVVSPRTRTGAFSRYEIAMKDPSRVVPEGEICAWTAGFTNDEDAVGAVLVRPSSIPR